ncbi:MAG: sigma-70 family RNA polymerase sigma factor [Treponema sp.]|uniref:RNA polymerase sigma factor n=1 Tax=Treponema sp. TaxID=166 RepID=UPI00298E3BA4|nr:sigma-70 family RNA polymerase sigma factor [Treponema sp.]MCR5387496.1 sigma-70 family RNA polymerase sigma factor [Treponema sp.]
MQRQRNDIEHVTISIRDSELVKSTLDGDQKSFARLMTLYKKRIVAIGMGFFKNAADTEDFVQEVFLKAYTKLDTFRGDSLFSTWLTRIAYNTAVNSVNRRDEYVQLSDESILQDPSDTPEEVQIRKVTGQAIREAIKELPEQYAICLDMYFFYDVPHAEISSITGLPINTIKSHIFRAKKILKEKLEERGFI